MKTRTFLALTSMVVVSPVAWADYASAVLADSPLAYYRFEEAAGATTLLDSSGNGLDATGFDFIGTTQLGEPGALGFGVLFNGDGSILTPLTLDPSVGDFTIEAFVNPTNLNNEAVFISNQNGAGLGRSNFIVQVNTGAFRSFIGGGGSNSTFLAEPDTWYHAILTYDKSAEGNPAEPTIRFYVNGEAAGDSQRETESANGGWVIGSHKSQTTQFYPGLLDEVAFYDVRLDDPNGDGDDSDSRIGAHYAAYLAEIADPVVVTSVTHDSEAGEVSISWESEAGKSYNLRSALDPSATSPEEWPIFGGNENIAATPPINTVTFPLPDEASRLFVVERFPAPPLFSENFDDVVAPGLPDGWETTGAGATAWELGDPAGGTGPDEASSGPNCVGTNLTTNYAPSADVSLISPAIPIPAGGATLSFQQLNSTC